MSVKIVVIGKPTEDELNKYKQQQANKYLSSLTDVEKQTPKLVTVQSKCNNIVIGMCPECGHCIMYPVSKCDECFQRVDWKQEGGVICR